MIAWWWFGVVFARSSKKEPFSFEPPRRNFDFFLLLLADWLRPSLAGRSLAFCSPSLMMGATSHAALGSRWWTKIYSEYESIYCLLEKWGPPLRMHGWQHKARCWFEMKSFILSKSEAFRQARCGGCRLSCYQSTVIFCIAVGHNLWVFSIIIFRNKTLNVDWSWITIF